MISFEKNKQESKQGFHFIFRGDKEILQLLNLKIQLTLTAQKPFVTSIPIIPIFPESEQRRLDQIIEPIIGIESFGQHQKQLVIKNKSLLKDNTLYIYFPSNIRVDEKVNAQKIFINSYENTIKEIPRNMRNNFVKLILYEQGVNENSIEQQKNKIYEALHQLFKINLEKKLQLYNSEINGMRNNELNLKNLLVLFKSKSMLAQLFRKMGVDQMCEEKLELVWQDMLYNQKLFVDTSIYKKDIIYLPPFIERNYQNVIKDFFKSDSFLKTCGYTFFKCFEMQLQLMNYCEAMKNLKKIIQFCSGNIFNLVKTKQQLLRNLWIMSVIDESYQIAHRLGRTYPTFLNPQREAEYSMLSTYIAKKYRQSIQIIGSILYNFNYMTSFPKTLENQVEQCLKNLERSSQKCTCEAIEEANIIMDPIQQNLLLVFGGFESYKLLYLKALINLYQILNKSVNKRNARAVKLIVLKTYLSILQPPNLQFSHNYLKNFSMRSRSEGAEAGEAAVYAYIDKILLKAQKCTLLDEEDGFIHDTVFKRSLRYSVEKDDFINRNREDQALWPQLKFFEDYLKFIILLISYRNEFSSSKNKEENPFNSSFSKSSLKIPVKTDNIIHLLLNQDLMRLQQKWETTVNLVREIFILEKGEQLKMEEKVPVNIRMGILIDARIYEAAGTDQHLIIKVNNKQLLNLSYLSQHSMIQLYLQIMDVNRVIKVIKLHLVGIKILHDEMMELQFEIVHKECLIFIIRELRVKIGLLSCYYVNKSLQIEEIKAMEEEERRIQKKKSRKYSSFEEKLRQEEFIHMVNKADHLALTHIHYHTLSITPIHSQSSKTHQNSIDFRDSSSQSSLYNLIKDKSITIPLYVDLWTPICYLIKANPLSKVSKVEIPLHKILAIPSQRQEISDWVRISNEWVSRSSDKTLRIQVESEGIQLMFMVKCHGVREAKANKKARKGSQISKSAYSSNASWQKGEFLRVQLELMQDEYKYQLQSNIYYSKNMCFEVKYMYCEDLEEYTFQNSGKNTLRVYHPSSECAYHLLENEQARLQSPEIEIQVDLERKASQECQAAQLPKFRSRVNLQNYIKKQLLKPEKLETCDLKIHNIQKLSSFKRLQVIKIQSSEAGVLSVLDAGNGFELIGKIQGELCLKEGLIDLFLLPIKTGKLILPSILIGEKKGLWKDEIFLTITQ